MNQSTGTNLDWYPTEEEVRAIVEELSPLLTEMAARERERLRQCRLSRHRARRRRAL
jgi:hypothetical protein